MAKTWDKAKWLEDSRVRVETAKKALEAGLAALQSGEDWKLRLQAMAALGPARLGRLSFRNSILVLLERPDARHVATFGTWRKLGRSVSKGSKALTILQPRFAPKDSDAEAIGPASEDGQKLIGFKPLSDLAQNNRTARGRLSGRVRGRAHRREAHRRPPPTDQGGSGWARALVGVIAGLLD